MDITVTCIPIQCLFEILDGSLFLLAKLIVMELTGFP